MVAIGKGQVKLSKYNGVKVGKGSAPEVKAFATSPALQALLKSGEVQEIKLDFSKAPDASFMAKLAKTKVDGKTNLHDLIRTLNGVGVEVAWKGNFKTSFMPALRDLLPVSFGTARLAPEVLPYAKALQDLVVETRQLASGFDAKGKALPLRDATVQELFLAKKLVALTQATASLGEKGAPVHKAALTALTNVAEVNDRLFYAMNDHVESVKRNLGQKTESAWPSVVTDKNGNKELVFLNTYRGEIIKDAAKRDAKMTEYWDKLAAKGGSVEDIVPFSAAFLKNIESGELFEFGAARGGTIAVSLNRDVKHPHMVAVATAIEEANGVAPTKASPNPKEKGAPTAGGSRFYRDSKGEVAVAFVYSNSGHYRPVKDTAAPAADAMAKALRVPRERVLTAAGDPFDGGKTMALDIWNFKAKNKGEMSKDQGNAFFAANQKLEAEADAAAAAFAANVTGGAK